MVIDSLITNHHHYNKLMGLYIYALVKGNPSLTLRRKVILILITFIKTYSTAVLQRIQWL